MPHWSEQLGGGNSASQGVTFAQASSVQLVPSSARRLAVTIYAAAGPVFLGYGATAVASVSMPLASGALIEESLFKGQINSVAGTGTAPIFYTDVLDSP